MFQPLPTPYAASLPYGVGGDFSNYGFISSEPGPGPASLSPAIFAASTPFSARQISPPLPPSAQPSQLPQHHQRQQHRRHHHHHHHLHLHKMDSADLASEMAAQEAAARDYNPDHTVPLVSPKMPSTAITEEYAKADPIYVAKTMALPQTYSHYRQVRGDGNCGWRAIAFAYFEQLVNEGDRSKVEAELARLTSLNNVLSTIGGYDMSLVAELIDETFVLLRDIATAIANPTVALDLLLERFNDPSVDAGIVYHLRLLAAASLRSEEATYAAFLAGGVDKYLKSVIEPLNHEIDHMGITLLVNILLKPADYALEVAYLDRSPGSEVNTYRLPEEASAQSPPPRGVIRLLFRPDHYDIIYLAPPPPPPQPPVQVNRVTPYAHQEHFQPTPPVMGTYAQVDLHPLSMIPGFGAPPPGLAPLATAPSPIAETYSPLQQSPGWLIPNYTIPPPPQRPMQPLQSQPQIAPSNHPVRFSKYNYPELMEGGEEPTFQTQIFKNSAYNVAHYSNPNFQPEEYKPGEDTGSRSGNKRRGS